MVDKIEAAVVSCRGEKVSAEFSEQNKDFFWQEFLLNIKFLHFLFWDISVGGVSGWKAGLHNLRTKCPGHMLSFT